MVERVHGHLNDAAAVVDLGVSNEWLPLLGPTGSAIVRVVVEHWPRSDWDVHDLAATCGVAPAHFWRSVDRLVRFGVAAMPSTDVVVVRRFMDPPSERALDRVFRRTQTEAVA